MTAITAKNTSVDVTSGMKAGMNIAVGYAPIALTYGLLAKTTGLTVIETLMMSICVFAGASQYIALNLITLGTGAFEIILTAFIVNIRHFLMSASLNVKSSPEDSRLEKSLYAFGITDETFSVAVAREGTVTAPFMYGLNGTAYGSWVVFSGLGYLFGAALPDVLQESMSVALYAMFIGLLVPSLKGAGKVFCLAGLAAVFNSIFTLSEALGSGWSVVSATLLSAVLVEGIETQKRRRG